MVILRLAAAAFVFFLSERAFAQAPSISVQPAAQAVAAGGNASFSVTATGAAPLSYQWYFNGATLASQTAASLALTGVTTADVGNYSVVVSNSSGLAISQVAPLTLNTAPTFTGIASSAGLIVEQGTTAVLTVSATGSPAPTLQWAKDGNPLAGETSATLTLTNVQPAAAGVYTVTATNGSGSSTSGSIELTVAHIGSGTGPVTITTALGTQVNANVDATNSDLTGGVTSGGASAVVAPRIGGISSDAGLMLDQGATATLSASVTGSPTPSYQWNKNGNPLAGQTGSTLTLTNVQPGDAGSYSLTATNASGTDTSDPMKVTVATLGAGGAISIAGGDGTQINGAYDTATGALTASVTSGTSPVAPKLGHITSTSGLLLELGQSASLQVIGSGSPTPTYQWYKNGHAITGATTASYAIASVAATDAGTYTVTAANTNGSVTSASTDVSVTSLTSGTGPLVIATAGGTLINGTVDSTSGALSGGVTTNTTSGPNIAPQIPTLESRGGVFVDQGSTLNLKATASGNPAPTLQWYRDGQLLAGQTSASLSLANVQPTDAGNYTLRATNASGTTTSDPVSVTVASISASGQLSIAGGDGTTVTGSYDPGTGTLAGGVTTGGTSNIVAPKLGSITGKSDLLFQLGQTATLAVTASGQPTPTYQWFKNGAALPGATGPSYTIANVKTTDAGTYTVDAINSAGTVTSAPVGVSITSLSGGSGPLTIATAGGTRVDGNVDPATGALTGGVTTNANSTVAPKIASLGSQGGLFLNQGSTATLTANATGSPTPTYQWFFNGGSLTGQTGSSLTLTNVQPTHAGIYTVRATNATGTSTSDAIPVTVASLGTSGQISITGGNGTAITANLSGTTLSGTSTTNPAVAANATTAARINSVSSDPGSLLIDRGATATLVVAGGGNPAPAYQWFKDGVALPGQTRSTLTFAPAQDSDAGSYTVRLTNSAGTTTSNPYDVTVVSLGANGSIAVSTATGTNVSAKLDENTGALIGSVTSGGSTSAPNLTALETDPASLLLNAGTSVTLTVLANATPAPTYQWYKNGIALPGRTGANLPLTDVQASDAGTYIARVTNSQGSTLSGATIVSVLRITSDGTVALATGQGTSIGGSVDLTNGNASGTGSTQTPDNPTPTAPYAHLVNLSARGQAGSGDNVVIAGFVIAGAGSRQLLVRAVGPGLTAFGVTDPLASPVLSLAHASQTLATNSNWVTAPNSVAIAQTASKVGAFPLDSRGGDAALLATLDPGTYTATISGATTASGQALMEVYDASALPGTSHVVNFSALQKLGSDARLTAGFNIAGNTTKRVLIRAIGPTLKQRFAIANALPAPTLRILSGSKEVASNRDYRTSPDVTAIITEAAGAGAFPLATDAADSAAILILAPGTYIAEVGDATGASGTAMVEIYELP